MFQREVVGENKIHILCSITSFSKIVSHRR